MSKKIIVCDSIIMEESHQEDFLIMVLKEY